MLKSNAQLDFFNEEDGITKLTKLLCRGEDSSIRATKALLAVFIDVHSPNALALVSQIREETLLTNCNSRNAVLKSN